MELSNDFIRHNQNKTLKELFPEICSTVLKLGKWYENDSGCVVNYQGDGYGYGFTKTGKQWYNNDGWGLDKLNTWAEADLSLVADLLMAEAKSRGFVEGAYFSALSDSSVQECNGKISLHRDCYDKIRFGYGNGLIFKQGKWAKILKVITASEAESRLNCLIRG